MMNKQVESTFHKFRLLRNKVDKVCDKLLLVNQKYISCEKGCDECCMNFRLLPVEFYYILNSIKGKEINIRHSDNLEDCPFLLDHSCQIYESRPLICHSHGLPILTMDEKGENWELSFCPHNFTENDDNYFKQANCFAQDVFYSKLYLLNQEFITNFDEEKFGNNDMLDLRKFANYL
jgi:uncharacterized protein